MDTVLDHFFFQLAMLATYCGQAESTALYHYCRSIMSQSPFSGGLENLIRLFNANKITFEELQLQQKNESLKVSKSDQYLKFKFFLTSFVRFHGLLFALSIRMHLDYFQNLGQITSIQNTLLFRLNAQLFSVLETGGEDPFKYCENMLATLLEEFDDIIHTVKMSDLHLLRLIGIGIFLVHFSEVNFGDILLEKTLLQSLVGSDFVFTRNCNNLRSKIQSYSLMCIFGIVSR